MEEEIAYLKKQIQGEVEEIKALTGELKEEVEEWQGK